jgi:hypothetical protein
MKTNHLFKKIFFFPKLGEGKKGRHSSPRHFDTKKAKLKRM